jgi:TonB family protein
MIRSGVVSYFAVGLILTIFSQGCSTNPASVDRDAIDSTLKSHRAEFRDCYERQVNASSENSGLRGNIILAFVIQPSGKPSQVTVKQTTLKNYMVENCVMSVLSQVQFPPPKGGLPVTVTYPFNFEKR